MRLNSVFDHHFNWLKLSEIHHSLLETQFIHLQKKVIHLFDKRNNSLYEIRNQIQHAFMLKEILVESLVISDSYDGWVNEQFSGQHYLTSTIDWFFEQM